MNIIHISLSFLFFFTFTFRNVFVVSTKNLCRTEQRDTLLKFKNEFEIQKSSCYDCSDNNDNDVSSPYPKTESWNNNTDCCYWDGITCDAKSGEVIELDLSCSCLHGRFHSNSTLFRFQNLRFLNLSHNDLYGQVPSSIEKLSHLTSLDLSDNQFSGQILSSVGKFSNLTSLRLTVNQFTGQIPSSIEKLSHLTFLDISHNQFSGKIPSSVGNLSQLTFLSFSSNPFSGPIPSSIGKLFYLETLNLAFNNLDGEIPSSFGNLNKLSFLRVDSNKLSGSFPTALLNLTNLSHLLLSKNRFTGKLPTNISSLSNFCSFYAPDNTFVGTLPSSLFTIPSIISIDLTNNNLVSLLCWNVSSPSNLQWLNLGNNNFRGPIPRSISKLVNLETLDISQWNTQGIKVDFRIFSQLKSLRDLRLSHLNTTTTIDLNAISSFSKLLSTLHLSGNHVLATKKSSVSDPPSQLIRYLYLSSCGITEFPELLRTQQNMDTLDISNNKIKGQVPVWLWMLPKIRYVDLSNNTFNGFQRPAKLGLSSSLEHLSGSKNNFTGNIPSFICELAYLRTLDLSDNNINGSIPLCLENLKTNLSVLNLHHNHLSGGLPEYVFESLWSFDVDHNQLVGKLPRSLMNSSTLEVLNVESNQINDTAPFWLNSLQNLKVLVLRSNAFHGPIHQQASFHKLKIIDISHNHFSGILPSDYFLSWSSMSSPGTIEDRSVANYMGEVYYQDSIILMNKGVEMEMVRILTIYTAIDFSQNRFEGEIPRSIGQLKELHVLNLSNNAFSGHIPSSMGNLTALESLDVSQNKLSGEIPQELGNLSFLSYMNFSHNQFVGLVPGGTQFRTQPCSSFENNSRLFGPVLDDNCRRIHTTSSKQYEIAEAKEEEEEEEDFSWIAAAIGLVPGNVFGLAIGYTLFSYKSERSKINADAISPQLSRELKNLWTKESMKQPNQMDCRERRQLIYDPIF